MKAKTISTKWIDKMGFESQVNGHKIIIDADSEVGGLDRGPRPKPLLQLALSGCTAMDVISILTKMRVELENFEVHVDGELTEEHPKHYKNMHLTYEFTGKNLDFEKLKKAVELSQDKYCGVSFMFKKIMDVTYEIKINETK